jgi:hypothetical protein
VKTEWRRSFSTEVITVLVGWSWTAAACADLPLAAPGAVAVSTSGTIKEGTVVPVVLKQRLKSGESSAGQPVRYEVARDVRTPDGREVLIPAGTAAYGEVRASSGAGRFGQPGELRFTCDYVQYPDGTRVPLRSPAAMSARGHPNLPASLGTSALLLIPTAAAVGAATRAAGDTRTAGFVISSLAVVGIGSLWRGREVTIKEGAQFEVVVERDTSVRTTGPAVSPAPPSTEQRRLQVMSR